MDFPVLLGAWREYGLQDAFQFKTCRSSTKEFGPSTNMCLIRVQAGALKHGTYDDVTTVGVIHHHGNTLEAWRHAR